MQVFEREPPRGLRKERPLNQHQYPTPPPNSAGADAGELQHRVLQLQEKLQRQESESVYRELQGRIADFIHMAVPRGSTMLIISKGDDELLDVSGRNAWHFPRAINGLYAGCYPANSKEAIAHLRKLRSEGAEYLVIPSTSFWWLEFYRGLARHLERRHRLVAYHEEVCLVFRLLNSASDAEAGHTANTNARVGR